MRRAALEIIHREQFADRGARMLAKKGFLKNTVCKEQTLSTALLSSPLEIVAEAARSSFSEEPEREKLAGGAK